GKFPKIGAESARIKVVLAIDAEQIGPSFVEHTCGNDEPAECVTRALRWCIPQIAGQLFKLVCVHRLEAGVVKDFADLRAARDQISAAASMSSTASTKPFVEPGLPDVTPLPKMIDASESGGVNCMTRSFSSTTKSPSNLNPSFS